MHKVSRHWVKLAARILQDIILCLTLIVHMQDQVANKVCLSPDQLLGVLDTLVQSVEKALQPQLGHSSSAAQLRQLVGRAEELGADQVGFLNLPTISKSWRNAAVQTDTPLT